MLKGLFVYIPDHTKPDDIVIVGKVSWNAWDKSYELTWHDPSPPLVELVIGELPLPYMVAASYFILNRL